MLLHIIQGVKASMYAKHGLKLLRKSLLSSRMDAIPGGLD
jgi:hypothetical protein